MAEEPIAKRQKTGLILDLTDEATDDDTMEDNGIDNRVGVEEDDEEDDEEKRRSSSIYKGPAVNGS